MTHTFNLNARSIRLVASHNGKQFKMYTGLKIEPSLWNRDAKSLPAKCRDRSVWEKLRLVHLRCSEKEGYVEDEADVLRVMAYAVEGTMPPRDAPARRLSFWEYFKEWSERDSTQARQRRLCYNNIARLMGTAFDWDDVDSAFHFRLVQKMQAEGFGINYQWKMVSQLKTVMNEGRKLKYHANLEYQDFKTKREDVDAVYLTKAEVDLIWDYAPKGELDRKARDLFLLGVYSCARFSDYSRLTTDMIHDGVIRFVQVKTSQSVLVPASPRLLSILERNGGHAPRLAQQHLNEQIKKICKAVGIDDIVEITKSIGVRHEHLQVPKWSMVTSHTARRTGIQLLYLTGITLQQVMLISGHKDEDSIRHYLRLTKEENVSLLKDNPFFK